MINGTLKKVTEHVQCQVTINILTDDALLCVFDFYVAQASRVETWQRLVHVCQRWRNIVFASPRRLNLRITCRLESAISAEKLNVWPTLPIVISYNTWDMHCYPHLLVDNFKAALEHNERVSQIELPITRETIDGLDLFMAFEKPFPALTDLTLLVTASSDLIFLNPVKFLGGFTCLQSLSLSVFRLPNQLLSSTGDLVNLHLNRVPITGFLSPEAIVTALSALTRLKVLILRFSFDQSRPNLPNRRSPLRLPTRAVLPSLTVLDFQSIKDDSEYLEDFMARIDAPLLDRLDVRYSSSDGALQLDTQQLLRFISRTPKLRVPAKAHIKYRYSKSWIEFSSPTQASSNVLTLGIFGFPIKQQLLYLEQFCRSPFFPLPTLENLYFSERSLLEQPQPADDIDMDWRWLKLFKPFTSVKNLYLSKYNVPVLQKLVGEEATEVLPTLENVFLENFRRSKSVHEAIGQFIAGRQLSGRPIVIFHWDRKQRRVDVDGEIFVS